MGIKHFKPTSPGRRQMTVSTFEEITTDKPEKSLTVPLVKKAGRNNQDGSPPGTTAAVTSVNIGLSISNGTRTAFPARLPQWNTTRTVPPISL